MGMIERPEIDVVKFLKECQKTHNSESFTATYRYYSVGKVYTQSEICCAGGYHYCRWEEYPTTGGPRYIKRCIKCGVSFEVEYDRQ